MTNMNADDVQAVGSWMERLGEIFKEIRYDTVVSEAKIFLVNQNGYHVGMIESDGEYLTFNPFNYGASVEVTA